MSRVNSSSLQPMHIPLGGMLLMPLIVLWSSTSMPFCSRGAQSAVLPLRGALATPVLWQP